jgi:hypothetical protein
MVFQYRSKRNLWLNPELSLFQNLLNEFYRSSGKCFESSCLCVRFCVHEDTIEQEPFRQAILQSDSPGSSCLSSI